MNSEDEMAMRNDDDQPIFSVLPGDAYDEADLNRLDREAAAKAGMLPETAHAKTDVDDGVSDKSGDGRNEKKESGGGGFNTVPEVLRHIQLEGRKIAKSKLYNDIKAGRLQRKDGVFRKRDVARYMQGLAMTDTPIAKADMFEERAVKKDLLAIQTMEAELETKETRLNILKGKYIQRDLVEVETAVRAIALWSEIKTAFEANAADICETVNGDVSLSVALVRKLERVCDDAFAQFARPMEFEVSFENMMDDDDDVTDDNRG